MSEIETRKESRTTPGRSGALRAVHQLVTSEGLPGLLLFAATAAALLWANSMAAPLYEWLLSRPLSIQLGDLALSKPLLLWVNDGLMAVFFLLVGLEIKREVIQGELSSLREAALPLFAALGGMAAPALIYLAFNHSGESARGWGIPMATDIAFALGVLALVGSRAPLALKVFLTAVAVVDDLGAVAVIALFYTEQVSTHALMMALAILILLWGMNRAGLRSLAPYLVVGAVLWLAVLKSGVHATVAGVALAAAIPAGDGDDGTPLLRLEHGLHPWVMLGVMPLFAFANAGVALGGGGTGAGVLSFDPVFWGILAGLVIGKPLGILGMAWIALELGWARRPAGVTWGHLTAAAMLCGIGFTMSLFIAQLAFGAGAGLDSAKLGILGASTVSALAAWGILRRSVTAADAQAKRARGRDVARSGSREALEIA